MFNINIVNQNNLLPIIPLFDMSKVPSIPWSNDYNHIKDIQTLERVIKTNKFVYADKNGNMKNKTNITGFALLTGEQSNIVVIDCDRHGKEDGVKVFDNYVKEHNININTLAVKTPTGGVHYYFDTDDSFKNSTGILPSVDVRANGGIIVLPGSKREDGVYEVINDVEIQELPNELKLLLAESNQGTTSKIDVYDIVENGISQGNRNDTLLRYLNKLRPNFNDIEMFAMTAIAINTQYVNPPLPLEEVETIAQGVWNYQMNNGKYHIPFNYEFDYDEQVLYKVKPPVDDDEEPERIKIYNGFLNIEGRRINIDDNIKQYILQSRELSDFNELYLNGDELFGCGAKELKQLFAKHNGFCNIITSNTANQILTFLDEQDMYKRKNNLMNDILYSEKIGWVEYKDEKHLVYPNKEIVIDKIESNNSNKDITKAFKTKGTAKEWVDNVLLNVCKSNNGRIVMLATFGSLLVNMLDIHENGIIQLEGATSTGKSSCLNGCCSIFGYPQDYLQSWNSTKVGIEETLVNKGSFPSIFDDLKQVNGELKKQLPSLFYDIVSGKNKLRGKKDGGLRDRKTFHNYLITSGEYPITEDLKQHDGAIARVIVLEGSFLPASEDNKIITDKINQNSMNYYGTVGLEWSKYLVENKSKLNEFKDMYNQIVTEMSRKVMDNTVKRKCNILGLLKLTAILLKDFFNNDYFDYNNLFDVILEQVVNTTVKLDTNDEILQNVISTISSYEMFNNEIKVGGKVIAKYRDKYTNKNGENFDNTLWIVASECNKLIEQFGGNSSTVRRVFGDRGYLKYNSTKKEWSHYTSGIKYIVFNMDKYEELIGENIVIDTNKMSYKNRKERSLKESKDITDNF